MNVYTVWAALKDDLEAHWMIWACDEHSYEGDPDARDAELAVAKQRVGAEAEFREINLHVSDQEIDRVFLPGEIAAEVTE